MSRIHCHMLLFVLLISGATESIGQKSFYNEAITNWQEEAPPDPALLDHTVFLVGDLYHPASDTTVLGMLKSKLAEVGTQGSIIFLGDIVYPVGMPDSGSSKIERAKEDLDLVLNTVKHFEGKVIFLPGNHDWQNGGADGWDHVRNEADYISTFLGSDSVYLPGGGCPGPVEVPLSKDVVAIVFDSQWWLQQQHKPGPEDGCDFEDQAGLFVAIEDMVRRNQHKKIVFATHHPLYSVGNHGGYFSPSRWIFPLLDINKYLYLPLPGFLYTWYRKYLGHIQDLSHPEYKMLRATLAGLFSEYPNVIYAAGHEHNLQYFEKDSLHHLVSGAGGQATYIARKKKKADFAYAGTGFSTLRFYKNGDVWTEYWSAGASTLNSLVFRKKLFNKPVFDPVDYEERISNADFKDSTVTVSLSTLYNRGKFVRFWMGDNYREIWETPVQLPVFDIGTEKGGLTILKRGGGQQTRSVRMEDNSGRQYVLRSVNKYVEKALDVQMRNTLAEDAVQDAISASHPYAALTVPSLASAAGVMHTNPQIVWVPDDPRLGIYRKDLANNVYLYEERPAGNRDDVASFGYSDKIVNTDKVVEKTQEDHDHRVDQESVIRARIFDLFLNDWDRHDDQWRWASFKTDEGRIYQPIPRDRDQVYFVNEGAVMWLASQDFIQPKFQGFDYKIKNVRGLGFNARYFDRSFATEPGLNDWLETAHSIQSGLSDSVIHEAISALPSSIYEKSGVEIEAKLRSRRNNLQKYAEGLYQFLAREVDVVGTDQRELFEVVRMPNGNTRVKMWALSKKKGKRKELLYEREFRFGETKEIRLYGLKGKDKFVVTGQAPKAIKTRLIGGKSNDTILDQSSVGRPGKTLLVYDRKDKANYIEKGRETRLILSKDKHINTYDRKQYKYDKTMPILGAGYNIDDGIFIGGGANIKHYNFRDSTQHKVSGTLAFQTQAFSINYSGRYSAFSRFFDLELFAVLSVPRNVDNFFGIGNETKKVTDDKSYYRVRYEFAEVNPMLTRKASKETEYKFGAFYQYFNVNDTAGRFVGDRENNNLDSLAFIKHHFSGLRAGLEIDTRNSEVLPSRGIFWVSSVGAFYGLDANAKNFIRVKSDLRFYLSVKADPRVVFAFRVGGAANIGNYEFYHANFIGGRTNLRGFKSNRFAGDQTFYQNTEIRFKLSNIRSYVFNGQTGFYLFNDIGRVWVEGEKSTRWHDGYGIGFWLTPFEFTALTFSYNLSYDDRMFAFNFRFLF